MMVAPGFGLNERGKLRLKGRLAVCIWAEANNTIIPGTLLNTNAIAKCYKT